jgi:hypothetical protein
MYQRIFILKKWEEVGLKGSPKKKVREFIKFVEENPQLGWESCAKEFREKYNDVFNDLIPPLMEIGDDLINLNLIRFFTPKRSRRDLELLKDFVKNADPRKLQPSFEAIAKLKIPSLAAELKKKQNLPPRISAILLEP